MRASERNECFPRALISSIPQRMHRLEEALIVSQNNGSKYKIADEKRDISSKVFEYWTQFLASQLDILRIAEDIANLEENKRSGPKSDPASCNQAVTALNTETADSCPSVSSVVSTCSESDSVISSPNPILPKSKPSRRAPGSFSMKDMLREKRSNQSQKDFNMMLVKEIHIMDGETGYGYDTLFRDALDSQLNEVFVNDPYIRLKSQSANFVVFCEVLIANAPNLRKITLRTQDDPGTDHEMTFMCMKGSLFTRGIELVILRSETIHDREIRFDNGWTYRIGRGLDYFQKRHYLSLGLSNYNLRQCLETIVCITKQM